jgi:hypothetical protein
MKSSPIFSVCSCAPSVLAIALLVLEMNVVHAQVPPGGAIIGQPPGQAPSSIIGQPVPGPPVLGQPGSALSQPVPGQGGAASTPPYPGAGSASGRDVTKDALDRANRDAANINLDGRIDPGEAARMPGITPPGRTPLPR